MGFAPFLFLGFRKRNGFNTEGAEAERPSVSLKAGRGHREERAGIGDLKVAATGDFGQ